VLRNSAVILRRLEQVVHLELDQEEEEIERLRLSAAVLKRTIKSLEVDGIRVNPRLA
jgi:hypothetical protein